MSGQWDVMKPRTKFTQDDAQFLVSRSWLPRGVLLANAITQAANPFAIDLQAIALGKLRPFHFSAAFGRPSRVIPNAAGDLKKTLGLGKLLYLAIQRRPVAQALSNGRMLRVIQRFQYPQRILVGQIRFNKRTGTLVRNAKIVLNDRIFQFHNYLTTRTESSKAAGRTISR